MRVLVFLVRPCVTSLAEPPNRNPAQSDRPLTEPLTHLRPPRHNGRLIRQQAASRSIRVFVSSTFRDMQEERDQLMSHT